MFLCVLSPLNSVQIPAKANSGRSSLSANQTTSFFLVSGLGSGAYSAKLLAGSGRKASLGLDQEDAAVDRKINSICRGC
jgi:hypothetical protein